MKSAYTEKKGQQAKKLHDKGKSIKEIAETIGVCAATISRWARVHKLWSAGK